MVTNYRFPKNSYPSSTTWCALTTKSRSWRRRNWRTTSPPNVKETPRSFSFHPWRENVRWICILSEAHQTLCTQGTMNTGTLTVMDGSGSAQRISQRSPVSGTSQGLAMFAICSIWLSSGLNPPCIQIILSSITAVHGRQLKVLQNAFHSLTL